MTTPHSSSDSSSNSTPSSQPTRPWVTSRPWAIWQQTQDSQDSQQSPVFELSAHGVDQAGKGTFLGLVRAPSASAALNQWERQETVPSYCVVEAHEPSGDVSNTASFAVLVMKNSFLRHAQTLADTMRQMLAASAQMPGGAPNSLTASFKSDAARVVWDNPDIPYNLKEYGAWELVVDAKEQTLMYVYHNHECTTTGIPLSDLTKVLSQPASCILPATGSVYARPDWYDSLIDAIEMSYKDPHMKSLLPILESACALAEIQRDAHEDESQKRIDISRQIADGGSGSA